MCQSLSKVMMRMLVCGFRNLSSWTAVIWLTTKLVYVAKHMGSVIYD